MQAVMRIQPKSHWFEKFLAGAVLCYSAVVFCLPVPVVENVSFPWWATRVAVGKVLLYEFLFLLWIAIFGAQYILRALLNGGVPVRQAALFLIALALWCGVISLATPLPWQDLGRTFRLLLNAALILAIVRWARSMGELPLVSLVTGLLAGTLINLVISFKNPLIVNDVMRLSGQSTPGVAMGIGIHLAAWLFFRASGWPTQAVAVLAAIVLAFGCGISYSRVGWFAGALGFAVWAYILFMARPRERRRKIFLSRARLKWVPALVLGLVALFSSSRAVEGIGWIATLIEQKFASGIENESNSHRAAYFIGVTEILAEHPMGVGYSGFYDAMIGTPIYRSGRSAREKDYEANPHSAFLYYAAAGSVPGLLLILAVFLMLLNSMRLGLVSAMGRAGLVFFLLAAPAYLLIGLTVPYLVNSIILIAPAAIAAGWGCRLPIFRLANASLVAARQ